MNLKTFETKIEGVRILRGERFVDERGFFEEIHKYTDFNREGLPSVFPQSNFSRSFQGVLRGLHIQSKNPQGKLVRCLHGTIFDVWVDLRKDSPTLKKYEVMTLSSEQPEAVYIPPGLAHGFFTASRIAIVQYMCTEIYDKESDGGIRFDDAEIGIEWPFGDEMTPHVSGKDMNLPTAAAYLAGLG